MKQFFTNTRTRQAGLWLLLLFALISPQSVWALSGSGTSDSPYLIYNATDLADFRTVFNGSNSAACAELRANIDLSNSGTWTPIGVNGHTYSGTFDGKNHSISGMSMNVTGWEEGLFGWIQGATIKDLTVSGTMTSTITNGSCRESIGGVVGLARGVNTITNVHSNVNITMNHNNFMGVGGVVGKVQEDYGFSTIKNCSYSGTLTLNSNIGYVGGIVGNVTQGATITNCNFTGALTTCDGCDYIGGIVGFFHRGDVAVTISNCTNAGAMTLGKGSEIGGIFGHAGGNLNILNNTFASGATLNTLTASTECGFVGGIAGKTDGTILIQECTAAGSINVGASYDCIAGIVGYCNDNSKLTIKSCLYSGHISNTSTRTDINRVAGIIAYASDNGNNFGGIKGCLCSGSFSTPSSNTIKPGAIASALYNNALDRMTDNNYRDGMATAVVFHTSGGHSIPSSNYSRTAGQIGSGQSNSGQVAYELYNGSIDGHTSWRQNIGTDNNPVLDQTHSLVYRNSHNNCSGVHQNYIYTNNNQNVTDAHDFSVQSATSTYLKSAATCTDNAVYYHKCSRCTASSQNNTNSTWTQVNTATGHSWGDGVWSWVADGHSATCTRTCSNNSSHKSSKSVTLNNGITSAVLTAATCTTRGTTRYTAKATVEGTTYTSTKDVTDIPLSGHTYTGSWSWNGSTPTLTLTCTRNSSHTVTLTTSGTNKITVTSSVTTQPTCTVKGYTTYSASVTYNNQNFSDSKTIQDVAALGHSWGDASWTWTDDGKSATCKRTCSRDASHTSSVTATTTNGMITSAVQTAATCEAMGTTRYTAKATVEGTQYTSYKDVADIPALGHVYTDSWSWNGNTPTLTLTCTRNSSHTVTLTTPTITVTSSVTTPATCTTQGWNTYSASVTYNNQNFSNSTTIQDVPALGHDFDANGVCTRTGCTVRQIFYRMPTYNTAGTPTSGIASWSTANKLNTEAAQVTSSDAQVTWGTAGQDSWYFVSDNVTLSKGAVCSGNVHLILCNGANLTVTNSNINQAGINVTSSNSLTIYAQSEGNQMGALSATGGQYGAGIGGGYNGIGQNITINGGTVTATGSGGGAGIGGGMHGSGQNITINGGTVTTQSNSGYGAGIGGGMWSIGRNIAINGGTVKAIGGDYASGIGNGIGVGGQSTVASNITISTALGTLAGSSANQISEIANNGGDLALALRDMRYVDVHLHQINNTSWAWEDDGSSVVLTITCSLGETITLSPTTTPAVTITSEETTAATCESEGTISYNATVTFYGTTYNAPTKPVNTPALGHQFGEDGHCTRCSVFAMGDYVFEKTKLAEKLAELNTNTSISQLRLFFVDDISKAQGSEVALLNSANTIKLYTNGSSGVVDVYVVPTTAGKTIYAPADCSSLLAYSKISSVSLDNFNTYLVRDMSNMFNGCSSLTSISGSADFTTTKVTNSANMFLGCTNLVGGNGTTYDANHTDATYAHFDNGTGNPGYFTCPRVTLDKSMLQSALSAINNSYTLTFAYSAPVGATKIALLNSANTLYLYRNASAYSVVPATSGAEILAPEDCSEMFNERYKLTSLDLTNFNTANVTNMNQMFYYCKALTTIDLSGFNTANVTDMEGMFQYCLALASLDLSTFSTAKATNMFNMFYYCETLTSLDLTNFSTANVTNMSQMFYYCKALTTIIVANGFTTTNVTNSANMFIGCANLMGGNGTTYDGGRTNADYAHIDLGSTNPGYFTAVPVTLNKTMLQAALSAISDNYTLTFAYEAPAGATQGAALNSDNTIYLYSNGSAYTVAPATSGVKILAPADCSEMFKDRSTITSLGLTNFNTASVTDMAGMFNGCSALTTITVATGFTTANVTNSANMFLGCTNLVGGNGTTYNANHTDATYSHFDNGTANPGYFTVAPLALNKPMLHAALNTISGDYTLTFAYEAPALAELNPVALNVDKTIYLYKFDTIYTVAPTVHDAMIMAPADCSNMFDQRTNLTSLDLTNFNTDNVTDMNRFFTSCKKLTSLTFGSNFNTANVKTMSDMFNECISITSLNLSGFNTANVTNMQNMFYNCPSLTSINFGSNFNTANVTNMSGMFAWSKALTSLDLSGFNTANVTKMDLMFQQCNALASLDLSGFNTANVQYIYGMFWGCSSVTTLDLSNFNTAKVEFMMWMFDGCTRLTSLDLSSFNTANVTNMNQMFNGCSSLTSLTISNFDMSQVKNMSKMLDGCTALNTLTVKALPYLKDGTFNTQFTGEGKTVNYDLKLNDNSIVYSGTNYLPAATAWTSAPTYTRQMSNRWGTIVVPFATTYDASNTHYKLYKLTVASLNGNEGSLTFIEYDNNASIPAGTPMVIKAEGEPNAEAGKYTVTLTANGNAVNTTIIAQNSTNASLPADWTMNGTYSKLTDQTGMYFIASNQFWWAELPITIAPYRAWFTHDSSSQAKSLSIVVEDEADGISLTPALSEREGVHKYLENGKVVIVRNGKKYNMNGQVIKVNYK